MRGGDSRVATWVLGVEEAREPSNVLKDFIDFCDNRPLVAHNIRFDFDILNSNLVRHGLKPYQNDQVVCSLNYAKEQQLPGKLGDLAHHYDIKIKDMSLHRALYDVETLKKIFDHIMSENEPKDMQYSIVL